MAVETSLISSLRQTAADAALAFTLQSRPQSYPADRGFYNAGFYKDRQLEAIYHMLPKLGHLTCDEWLTERVDSANYRLKVLDVGCGTGRSLKQIEELYGKDKVEIFGLTACLYHPLQIARDRITVGDLSYPARYYPKKNFDLIYSYMSIIYSRRPIMNVIKKLYSCLNDNGAAFLSFDIPQRDDIHHYSIGRLDLLRDWLTTNGYDFDFGFTLDQYMYASLRKLPIQITRLAFRKTRERLLLPLVYEQDKVSFNQALAEKFSHELSQSG